jgi:hypothetical protein
LWGRETNINPHPTCSTKEMNGFLQTYLYARLSWFSGEIFGAFPGRAFLPVLAVNAKLTKSGGDDDEPDSAVMPTMGSSALGGCVSRRRWASLLCGMIYRD